MGEIVASVLSRNPRGFCSFAAGLRSGGIEGIIEDEVEEGDDIIAEDGISVEGTDVSVEGGIRAEEGGSILDDAD